MKIIYSPFLDTGYYVNLSKNNDKLLGTKIVGNSGLLEYLSLHNGLSGLFVSDGERASAYLSHVRKNAHGTMIETSFNNDALGVAKCLLHWRDVLIMSGWTPSQGGNDTTPKLQLLNKIEQSWKGQLKGSADRWLELAHLSKSQSLLANDDTIECRCTKESLPCLIQNILVSCKASFIDLSDDVQIPDTTNISVLHYNDLSDAYRYVAAHTEDYADTVIINRDNVSLNHILFSWGQPLVGATIEDSNPITLQIFKLALSVFSRPLNINNLLSYLQLPVGPVPAKFRHELANVLISEGGFGEIDWSNLDKDNIINEEKAEALRKEGISTKWDLAIYDYINEEEESAHESQSPTKAQRRAKAYLLKHITDDSLDECKNIPVETLRKYIGNFMQWASSIVSNNDDEMQSSQLATVVSYFKQLSDALTGIDEISYSELEKHVRTIYQPTTITQAHAQVGSLNVITSYNQIVDTPDNLLWLDCCGADQLTDQYEFLSTSERTWLNSQEGITIPVVEDILELNRKEMILALSKVTSNITLVTSDYHHNKKMAEHPLVAELKMLRGSSLVMKEGECFLPLSEMNDVKKIEPNLKYEIGALKYPSRSESNTSIDTLINYPFDYVAHYIACLNEATLDLGSIKKITGLVAHSFIENLVADVSAKPEAERIALMESLLSNEYKPRLKKAINTTGLVLLLKENEVDYNNLHYLLKRSVEVLIDIMKAKHLIPIGCELCYDASMGDTIKDFNARIDMELKDAQGKTVIFDFKWSYAKYYGEKIKEGKAIQLELYRQELKAQGKNVSAVGYYLLPKCVLETADYETLKDSAGKVIIRHIEPPHDTDLFEQIQNSIIQRRNELNKGFIEEGEGMDIKELSYSKVLVKGTNMLAVGTVKKNGGPTKKEPNRPWTIESIKKKSPKVFVDKPESRFFRTSTEFGNDNKPLNETPTTYPLMKGRLK